MILLLEKALEGSAAAYAFLYMDSNDDIAILAGLLWLNYHIVTITDMILDHRTATYDQCIGILAIYQFVAYLN